MASGELISVFWQFFSIIPAHSKQRGAARCAVVLPAKNRLSMNWLSEAKLALLPSQASFVTRFYLLSSKSRRISCLQ
jgi:hypothetical protein